MAITSFREQSQLQERTPLSKYSPQPEVEELKKRQPDALGNSYVWVKLHQRTNGTTIRGHWRRKPNRRDSKSNRNRALSLENQAQIYLPTKQDRHIAGKLALVLPEDWYAELSALRYQLLVKQKRAQWFVRLITIKCLLEMLWANLWIKLENIWLLQKSKVTRR